MHENEPVGDKNTDHDRTVPLHEYYELRNEFLAEMREYVRQGRMQAGENE